MVTPSKTLITEIHDQATAEALYVLFDDDEHREELEHEIKATRAAVKMCKYLNYHFPHVEGLNWADFEKFVPKDN